MEGPDLARLDAFLRSLDGEILGTGFATAENAVAFANDAMVALGDAPLDDRFAGMLAEASRNPEGRKALSIFMAMLAAAVSDAATFRAGIDPGAGRTAKRARDALFSRALELARHAEPVRFLSDPEGREELARTVTDRFGLLPSGETRERAEDRLKSVDSVERARVVAKAKEARKRAEEIRRAIEAREAEEAASKMTRE